MVLRGLSVRTKWMAKQLHRATITRLRWDINTNQGICSADFSILGWYRDINTLCLLLIIISEIEAILTNRNQRFVRLNSDNVLILNGNSTEVRLAALCNSYRAKYIQFSLTEVAPGHPELWISECCLLSRENAELVFCEAHVYILSLDQYITLFYVILFTDAIYIYMYTNIYTHMCSLALALNPWPTFLHLGILDLHYLWGHFKQQDH